MGIFLKTFDGFVGLFYNVDRLDDYVGDVFGANIDDNLCYISCYDFYHFKAFSVIVEGLRSFYRERGFSAKFEV